MKAGPWLLVLVSTFGACHSAVADDIDKAFRAQDGAAGHSVKVDKSVAESIERSRAGVAERANAKEEARRKDIDAASAVRGAEQSTVTSPAGAGKASGAKDANADKARSAGRNSPRDEGVHRLREFWVLKSEVLSITVRCPGGAQRNYDYFPKTGRYCTPMMTCGSSEAWAQSAVCP